MFSCMTNVKLRTRSRVTDRLMELQNATTKIKSNIDTNVKNRIDWLNFSINKDENYMCFIYLFLVIALKKVEDSILFNSYLSFVNHLNQVAIDSVKKLGFIIRNCSIFHNDKAFHKL